MATGKVQVNNLNQGQGPVTEIERHFLFVGTGSAEEASALYSINAQTDIEKEFADTPLRKQLIAAQLGGGQNWSAAVYPLAADEAINDAIDRANEVQSFEAVVVCDPVADAAAIQALQDKALSLQAKLGRWVFVLAAVDGIDAATQTWSAYEAATVALVDGLACHLVVPVPQLNGNNAGALAGRLCNRGVSIADSPMRVATGAVPGLGAMPVDSAGEPLSLATVETLANARLSVPQWYADFDGVYWTDGSTLDAEGGDYQVIENLRVVHKASREVRMLAIQKMADRSLNSTPNSISYHQGYFMKPLRKMSKSYLIGGKPFPGDVMPPQDGDITIDWKSKTQVVIFMVVRPYDSPKSITVNILLDQSA